MYRPSKLSLQECHLQAGFELCILDRLTLLAGHEQAFQNSCHFGLCRLCGGHDVQTFKGQLTAHLQNTI